MPHMTGLAIAFCLPGPLLALYGLTRLGTELGQRSRWVRVPGEITEWSDGDHPNPTITFTTLDGRQVSRQRLMFDIGIYTMRSATVWYCPADPSRFSWQVRWLPLPGLVPLLVSLPLLWLTIAILR